MKNRDVFYFAQMAEVLISQKMSKPEQERRREKKP